MTDDNYKPRGDGVVQGDDKPMPNRGTGTGMVGMGAPYGASIDPTATNGMGSIHDVCGSDAPEKCYADNPVFTFPDHREAQGGTHLSGTESDPVDKDRADNPLL